jgi:hypothetical protein
LRIGLASSHGRPWPHAAATIRIRAFDAGAGHKDLHDGWEKLSLAVHALAETPGGLPSRLCEAHTFSPDHLRVAAHMSVAKSVGSLRV